MIRSRHEVMIIPARFMIELNVNQEITVTVTIFSPAGSVSTFVGYQMSSSFISNSHIISFSSYHNVRELAGTPNPTFGI